VDDSTPASPRCASASIYGFRKRLDHYTNGRESGVDGKTARRQEILRSLPTTHNLSPDHPMTLSSSVRARPGSTSRLFSIRAGRGCHNSFASARRGATGYAPPCAASSGTEHRSPTSSRSPPRSTADRHCHWNRCPRTSHPPSGFLPNRRLKPKVRRRQDYRREDQAACRSATVLHLPRAPVPSRRAPGRGND
jgi:hypothetical protein